MSSIGFTSSALLRQSREARLITENSNKNLMNRKREWGQNLPPKLTVEDDFQGQTESVQGQPGRSKRPREVQEAEVDELDVPLERKQ